MRNFHNKWPNMVSFNCYWWLLKLCLDSGGGPWYRRSLPPILGHPNECMDHLSFLHWSKPGETLYRPIQCSLIGAYKLGACMQLTNNHIYLIFLFLISTYTITSNLNSMRTIVFKIKSVGSIANQ